MPLEFLKIHFVSGLSYRLVIGKSIRMKTACGREAPDWARRTTGDPDFVTCDVCLAALTRSALQELAEVGMSTTEILERRG